MIFIYIYYINTKPMEQDNFSIAEQKSRDLYRNILEHSSKIKDFYFTPTRFDRVDVVQFDGECSATTELKYRTDYPSTNEKIQKEGALIEKVKFDYIQNTIEYSGMCDGYYVMFFNDGVGYVWSLKDKKMDWHFEHQPQTTMGKNNNKVNKLVGKLKLTDGIKFKFQL